MSVKTVLQSLPVPAEEARPDDAHGGADEGVDVGFERDGDGDAFWGRMTGIGATILVEFLIIALMLTLGWNLSQGEPEAPVVTSIEARNVSSPAPEEAVEEEPPTEAQPETQPAETQPIETPEVPEPTPLEPPPLVLPNPAPAPPPPPPTPPPPTTPPGGPPQCASTLWY